MVDEYEGRWHALSFKNLGAHSFATVLLEFYLSYPRTKGCGTGV